MAVREQKAVEVAAAVAVSEPPTPQPVAISDGNIFDMVEYKALVAELGVDDSAIRNQEFRQFLADEGIQVYDYEKVVAFLDAKVRGEAKKLRIEYLIWMWKPVNSKYPVVGRYPQHTDSSISGWIVVNGNLAGSSLPSTYIYSRPIPHPVLLTMKKIKDKFGDQVAFYVSDYEVRTPDPFLMVTGPGLDFYCVERWDEPNFRG